jgi:hypothetical protein
MKNYYEYTYETYKYRLNQDFESTYGEYSSGSSYSIDAESQVKKIQKRKEMESNIPKRALMLEKLFDGNLPHLPHLPSEFWNIIAEYEGGVESSLLGDNVTSTSLWSWCILSLKKKLHL